MKLIITIMIMTVLMGSINAGQLLKVKGTGHSNQSVFNSDNDSATHYTNCFQKGPASKLNLDMRKQTLSERNQARIEDSEQNYQYKKKMLDWKYNKVDDKKGIDLIAVNKKVKRFEIKLSHSLSLDVKKQIEIEGVN